MTTHDSSSQPARPATSPSASPAPDATPTPRRDPSLDGDYAPRIEIEWSDGRGNTFTAQLSPCNRCGAVVMYTPVHTDWHRQLRAGIAVGVFHDRGLRSTADEG